MELYHVFRHGEKVPHKEAQNYPNDPYRDYSYYPLGNGDLTNEGKLREYKIGKMLREHYNQYFGPDYWPEKIYARSTFIPRTQLSVQLVLAGLFPPSEKQTWNPDLPWIPTHSFFVPHKHDNLMFPYNCPKYKEEYNEFLKSNEAQNLLGKYKYVMNYLTERSGKVINTTSDILHFYNLLKEQGNQNLTLPKWTEAVYPALLKEIVALHFKLRSYTNTLKRLNGGLLIRKIVEDIKLYIAGRLKPYDRKAFFFSGHEMNVAAVVRALELDEPIIPLYGSTIILETLRDKKKNYYIRVLFWSGEQLKYKTIPGCTELCPLYDFFGIVKDIIPNDDEYHCHPNEMTMNEQINSSASNLITGEICCLITVINSTLLKVRFERTSTPQKRRQFTKRKLERVMAMSAMPTSVINITE
ncbi:Testicular acid phosphatase [Apis cerana cerana]|uniref:acid phosphatase n=1 Tax=Apis cerana cerana TaxID=94128 RepID=A0A2A3EK97_APICC|nr:Testicular acid phosphatase [Apis cerana cerana]